jgi:hypothetical protein
MTWRRYQSGFIWNHPIFLMAVLVALSGSTPASGQEVYGSDALACDAAILQEAELPSQSPSADLAPCQQASLESYRVESSGELDADSVVLSEIASGEVGALAPEFYSIFIDRPDHLITLPGTPPPAGLLR